jgi:putative lipoprotein
MRVLVLLALGGVVGCSPPRGDEPVRGAQEPGGRAAAAPGSPASSLAGARTFVFACPDGPEIVVRVDGERAAVFAPGMTYLLPHVPAASGARYSDGTATFWSKGEEAFFELPIGSWSGCRNDRGKAVWEHAKLDGADFRAVGNEPGWVLVMYPDRWVFETGYGETRVEVPAVPPATPPDAARTVWESEAGGHHLRIVAEPGPCRDSMADLTFETRVIVELDGVRHEGCGKPLH